MTDNEQTEYRDIGLRLRAIRKSLGINQIKFAKALDVKQPVYWRWEVGQRRITIECALRIKHNYGVSLDWIYDGDPHTKPKLLSGSDPNEE